MTSSQPMVSIGVPVYNGEDYLASTLESILGQSFGDCEVIICDNASTDATEAICAEYAARDSRVRYHRQPKNLGAAPNYNDVYHRSRGRYFKWSAHDDLIEPTFLERCVAALEANPQCPVAFTRFHRIDADGNRVAEGDSDAALCAADPRTRAGAAIRPHQQGGASDSPIFGVMRRSALDRTRLHGSYTGSDRTLVLELALQGPLLEIPEHLFLNRDHPSRSIRIWETASGGGHVREAWFDSGRADKIVFPNWLRLGEFITAIVRSPLAIANKARCLAVVGGWVAAGSWKRLAYDVLVAVRGVKSRYRPAKATGPNN